MYTWEREAYIWGVNWVSYLEAYLQGGVIYRDILSRFYDIEYGIEFHHFMKSFENSKGKKNMERSASGKRCRNTST